MKAESRSLSILRTPAGVIATLPLLGVIGYAAWIFSDLYSLHTDLILAGIGLTALPLLLATFGLAIVFRRNFISHLRRGWLLISLGSASLAAAYGIALYQQALLGSDPFPGVADIFHSAFYPLTLAGLLLFPVALVMRQQRSVLYLDLAIIVLGFSMILWHLMMAPLNIPAPQDKTVFWAIAYPIGDFILLAAAIALIQRDLLRPARWVLFFIASGMVFAALADLLFATYELNEIAYPPAFLHTLWMCSVQSLLFAAAWQIASSSSTQGEVPARSSPALYLLRLALPYFAVALGLSLLVHAVITDGGSGLRLLGILFGAVVMVGLVLLRQYLVLKENLRLYQTVQRIAWTDGLTGLYNRHFFNEILPRELDHARRYQENLSVLLLDVDGFKKYNDTFGHLQGDIVLKAVARVFASQLRASDTIARFGGDEFVIILPSANRRLAQSIAQRIRSALAEQAFNGTTLGVSVGVAVYRPGLTPEQLLEEADKDLYRHKAKNNNGKYRVPIATSGMIDSPVHKDALKN